MEYELEGRKDKEKISGAPDSTNLATPIERKNTANLVNEGPSEKNVRKNREWASEKCGFSINVCEREGERRKKF